MKTNTTARNLFIALAMVLVSLCDAGQSRLARFENPTPAAVSDGI